MKVDGVIRALPNMDQGQRKTVRDRARQWAQSRDTRKSKWTHGECWKRSMRSTTRNLPTLPNFRRRNNHQGLSEGASDRERAKGC